MRRAVPKGPMGATTAPVDDVGVAADDFAVEVIAEDAVVDDAVAALDAVSVMVEVEEEDPGGSRCFQPTS